MRAQTIQSRGRQIGEESFLLGDESNNAICIPSFAYDFNNFSIFKPEALTRDKYLKNAVHSHSNSVFDLLRTTQEYNQDPLFRNAESSTRIFLPIFAKSVQQRLDDFHTNLQSALGMEEDIFYVNKAFLRHQTDSNEFSFPHTDSKDHCDFTIIIALQDDTSLTYLKSDFGTYKTCPLKSAGDAILFQDTSWHKSPMFNASRTIALIMCSFTPQNYTEQDSAETATFCGLDTPIIIQALNTIPETQPIVPTVEYLKQKLETLSAFQRYLSISYPSCTAPIFDVMIRYSTVPRRGNDVLDFDIVQIGLDEKYQKQGFGTQFFKNMVEAAKLVRPKRGIYLEQCITFASQNLRKKLIDSGLAIAVPHNDLSALSVS